MRLAEADAGHAACESAAYVLTSHVMWSKSSFCATQSCVEVGDLPDGSGVAIRDSKSGASPILVFTMDEWESFLSGVKAGEFG